MKKQEIKKWIMAMAILSLTISLGACGQTTGTTSQESTEVEISVPDSSQENTAEESTEDVQNKDGEAIESDGKQMPPDGERPGDPPDKPDGERPGDPPDGEGGGTPPGGFGGGSSADVDYNAATEITAADAQTGKSYESSTADESALLISTTDSVTITDVTVKKTGDSDGGDNCNFYGLNAAVLVKDGATATITGATITSDADGQELSGNILVGSNSTLTLNLKNGSSFSGSISGNITNAAGDVVSTETGTVAISIDADSTWTLTADSYVTSIEGCMDNVNTNGYVLYINGVAQ